MLESVVIVKNIIYFQNYKWSIYYYGMVWNGTFKIDEDEQKSLSYMIYSPLRHLIANDTIFTHLTYRYNTIQINDYKVLRVQT